MPGHPRAGRAIRFTTSLIALAALVAGLPAALVCVIGSPLPASAQQAWLWATTPPTGTVVEDLLAMLVWLLWLVFVATLVDEARYLRRGEHRTSRTVLNPMRYFAATLIAGLMMSPAATAATAMAAPPIAALPPVAVTTTVTAPTSGPNLAAALRIPLVVPDNTTTTPATDPSGHSQTVAPAPTQLIVLVGHQHYTYTVKTGDTLWHISAQWLGNPMRWSEIYHLNQHAYDQHGRMRHGDHIQTGWVLTMPDGAAPPAGATPVPAPVTPPAPAPAHTRPAGPPAAGPAGPGTITPTTPATPGPASAASTGVTPSASPSTTAPTPTTVSAAPTAPPPSARAAPAATATNADQASPAQRHRPAGVRLPEGGWVDLGLAAAIVAATALVWAHRRRRYTPRPPSPDLRLDDPELAPMPPAVTQIRRGLRQHAPRTASPGWADRDADLDVFADGQRDRVDPLDVDEPDPDQAEQDDLSELDLDDRGEIDPAAGADWQTEGPQRPDNLPAVPALNNPLSAVWPPAGLGLTGPGAQAAARGFLAAALAAGGLNDPDARSWVVMPSATAATLLGAAAVQLPTTPRLTISAGLDDALEILETQTLHRTRLVYRREVDDVAALRRADPYEEPLPPIVLIADAVADHERARIAALLSQGQRLDIHGVLVGQWPAGNTVAVAEDGTTSPADGDTARHGRHPADLDRLSVLDPGQTLDLITTLAESHTGLAHRPPVETPASASQPSRAGDGSVSGAVALAPTDTEVPVQGPTTGPGSTAEPPAATPAVATTTWDAGEEIDADVTERQNAAGSGPQDTSAGRVQVRVLGEARILGADPTYHLRAKSLELLVYLAVHDGAARHDAILDDLIPEAPAAKAPHRLHTYVSALRNALRRASGTSATFINHAPMQYTLINNLFDIDLWRMRQALRDAQHATDPQSRTEALRRAVTTYHGPLAEGFDYDWIEPYRQAIRQQVLDAHLALADTLDGHPHDQLAILHAAIDLDPYSESTYQQAMRAHSALRDLDAIRTLRQALTRRLAEIDAEPDEATIALADLLVTQLRHHPSRTEPRRAADPGDDTAA
ncbi:hypothetical protein GCM10023322_68710 [Rugosimonospora acidiphila]|uniref:LysM domain-containing protein n=1 Tax=Rugosimonospora acidiphila TaxID=556531 RepID=A0ABP9SLR2_9ACTN